MGYWIEKIHFYQVYIGEELWYHLTGDKLFYFELGKALAKVAIEFDGTNTLQQVIAELAQTETIQRLASS